MSFFQIKEHTVTSRPLFQPGQWWCGCCFHTCPVLRWFPLNSFSIRRRRKGNIRILVMFLCQIINPDLHGERADGEGGRLRWGRWSIRKVVDTGLCPLLRLSSPTPPTALLPVSLSWMKAGGLVSSVESVAFGDFPQKSAPPQLPIIESAEVGLGLLLFQGETLTSEERVNESPCSALRMSYLLYTWQKFLQFCNTWGQTSLFSPSDTELFSTIIIPLRPSGWELEGGGDLINWTGKFELEFFSRMFLSSCSPFLT